MQKVFEYYKPHFKIMIYIVVFIVCFGLAALLLSQGTSKKVTLPFANSAVTPTVAVANGTKMDLVTASGMQNYSMNQDVELTVKADTNNIAVTGYDMLFLYDPNSISIVKVTSADPTFDIFTFNNKGYVSITGTKKLSVSAPSLFSNSSILSIVVRPVKAGSTPVIIAPQIGREKTKFVDDKANIVVPELNKAVQLNIK